ncbi:MULTISPECIES: nitrogen fixation protein NifZ [unclassified Oceanobacter]|jgi:nitrogen fixation protein NifZ|uniref:nitrogen fixation protein NifZ n=1 Tax=unclassified Oceanobacter TaxID=2620260 RepID=UPI0026E1B730|nr:MULTISPECIES: nitrogen fixation protein NifZ [unclassified Oceanobacter]MDO6681693.1 nitrogen fixation protein NifZ [Oceanobacter sp. 5_MG-2023]MDP2505679.1 nitrogen fixation protein NifZ [Oceanobacter sp. 3_MG-2023]MDP2547494.1 nitrogen fixation protein NifZ [Oceanobacter sp. 4_MG-2023]MDP2608282.1 nitrogen fixation protein NifZ [Oceanobacter sp. 1_MG-2023]MDP2612167.1 nitrogen fixation protein NifZ [Oceanobacter sp. 2_MG-2023]
MTQWQKGDAVFATVTIINDGSVPSAPESHVFAEPGTMGMLINTGHLEENPEQEMLLVCFPDEAGNPFHLVTCFPDEISAEPPVTH